MGMKELVAKAAIDTQVWDREGGCVVSPCA